MVGLFIAGGWSDNPRSPNFRDWRTDSINVY